MMIPEELAFLSLLKLLNLLLKELAEELAKLVESDLAALVLVQHHEHLPIAVLHSLLLRPQSVRVGPSHALEKLTDEGDDLVLLEGATVVSVDRVENALVYLSEFFLVREHAVQVLNRFRVVHHLCKFEFIILGLIKSFLFISTTSLLLLQFLNDVLDAVLLQLLLGVGASLLLSLLELLLLDLLLLLLGRDRIVLGVEIVKQRLIFNLVFYGWRVVHL
jgi:hypothetical protein